MNFAFEQPALLWALPLALLPLLPRRVRTVPISTLDHLAAAGRSWRTRLAALEPVVALATLLLLILALAGPVAFTENQRVIRRGIDLMLVLDISASMGAADIPPDRLSVARAAAAEFIAGRSNDRVGVVLFAGIPYLLAPPTLERAPLLARLAAIEPDRQGSGTAVGDALAAAAARLAGSDAASRAVILLTDGSNNRGHLTPVAAARAAAALGIRIYSIGYGTSSGAPVPLASPAPLLRESLHPEPLREIARLTGGRYFPASDASTLREVYRQIDALETSPLETRVERRATPLAPALALAAALLLGLELLLWRCWLRRVP
ncbi:VWA domain-containing protein [Desulfuromonas carbonis]|uniref:VWA domain-containing protein n=1 Tax=Desulfuromonas sp. DDH964 TaxID=1823759 RepID=UPI00078E8E19|nr:VWA domain-containing protein [Desulfuromonas sp. DDH964]AMV72838.1 hypothetical protein DBW_2508 [Desulfuromonas sp. DDH964]